MPKITVTIGDGSKKQFEKGTSAQEVAEKTNAKNALVADIDGALFDLSTKIEKDANIKFIDFSSQLGKSVFWHSAAHVLANAVVRLFPKAKITIGPGWEGGFYYDIDYKPFNPEDLQKIEKEMQRIVDENSKFERISTTKAEAKKLFRANQYKKELIDEAEGNITVYRNSKFIDLCRGPHVPNTGCIKAFRLIKTAGAYWKGDQKNKQLQRIYGTAFPTKKELDDYLKLQAEAEKRDHRKSGKDLDLFSFHEEGPGFPFFHPKGMDIKNALIDFWREAHKKANYREIQTPMILSRELWKKSGHWDNYRENMYFLKIDDKEYAVKPMNCPGAMIVYKQKIHSYRELPLRIAELGLVHRHELSGVLAGLFRVRSFTQDDAHIFMMPEHIKEEVASIIELIDYFYSEIFRFPYHVELSTRPTKSIGTDNQWRQAETGLMSALEKKKIKYAINPGDGAFYGPKIDFHIKDCLGRTWQCATIQLDMAMPERFDLTYEGKDGKKHRPVMIHRVIYGSIERFIAILLEHYAGRLPLWLSPEQVRILTIADRFRDYGEKIMKRYEGAGIRATLDDRAESIGYKVREAQLNKVNYILVVGEKEKNDGTVAVRTPDGKVMGAVKTDEFLKKLIEEIKSKK